MLGSAMELMPRGVKGEERRIHASACIMSYCTKYLLGYITLEDPFIRLLGLRDEFECLSVSLVMRIYAVLDDTFGKLRSEYGVCLAIAVP